VGSITSQDPNLAQEAIKDSLDNVFRQMDKIRISCREILPINLFKQWVTDGLTSCSDIATEMGVSKGTISKLAKKAEEKGSLEKVGKGRGTEYKLIQQRN